MRLDTSITISRVTVGGLGNQSDHICIDVQDDASGCHFVTVTLGLDEFALAVTGLGGVECTSEVRGLDKIGLMHEHKEECILIPIGFAERTPDAIRAAIKPFETDGWSGRDDDATNGNRIVQRNQGDGGAFDRVRVSFHRWVPKEAADANRDPH